MATKNDCLFCTNSCWHIWAHQRFSNNSVPDTSTLLWKLHKNPLKTFVKDVALQIIFFLEAMILQGISTLLPTFQTIFFLLITFSKKSLILEFFFYKQSRKLAKKWISFFENVVCEKKIPVGKFIKPNDETFL